MVLTSICHHCQSEFLTLHHPRMTVCPAAACIEKRKHIHSSISNQAPSTEIRSWVEYCLGVVGTAVCVQVKSACACLGVTNGHSVLSSLRVPLTENYIHPNDNLSSKTAVFFTQNIIITRKLT